MPKPSRLANCRFIYPHGSEHASVECKGVKQPDTENGGAEASGTAQCILVMYPRIKISSGGSRDCERMRGCRIHFLRVSPSKRHKGRHHYGLEELMTNKYRGSIVALFDK